MHANPVSGTGPALGTVTASLQKLGAIGALSGGGITRLAFSPALLEAHRWAGEFMRELGLEVSTDAAGNLLGRWDAGAGRALLVGSHLDTVPSGGRFDGALGVVAAIHAAAALRREGFQPRRPLWIVAFMDEEGARFATATFGSRAFVGEPLGHLGERVDEAGVTLRQAMLDWGLELHRIEQAARVGEVGEYLELHIEQGPQLEAAGCQIAAVTSIVGLRGFLVRLLGQAAHAGTTPMARRRDAFVGAARIALALREHARCGDGTTATVGRVTVRPGAANVIPQAAELTVDVRASTLDDLDRLTEHLRQTVARVAGEERLGHELEPTFSLDPTELDPELVEAVQRAARAEGAASLRMPSGAGHDAMVLGRHVPAGMLFVPSVDGISHSPAELTSAEHVEIGTRVLTALMRERLSR